jgi:hypothetical protein
MTLVDTITPEAAKVLVETLNSGYSRFDQILQVQTKTGEVVLECEVAERISDAVDDCRSLQMASGESASSPLAVLVNPSASNERPTQR